VSAGHTDHEMEPIAGEPPVATPTTAKAAMPKSTRILAMTAGGVAAAAAAFGGAVAFGTSLNSGASTPPTGMTGTGPGGTTGTAPTGAPTNAAGGNITTG
jgi:hypothetical protein